MEERISKSSLLLMEMIISLFFFALASVVCVQLYSNAHTLSKNAEESTRTVGILSNFGEAYYASNGDLNDALQLFAHTQTVFPEASNGLAQLAAELDHSGSDGSESTDALVQEDIPIHLYFDRNWNLINVDHSTETTIVSRTAYVLTVQSTSEPDSRMQSVDAAMYEFKTARNGLSFISSQEFLCYQVQGGAR